MQISEEAVEICVDESDADAVAYWLMAFHPSISTVRSGNCMILTSALLTPDEMRAAWLCAVMNEGSLPANAVARSRVMADLVA